MIKEIKEELEKEREIVFAYLFGSFVRNKKYAKDVDIAVFVRGKASPDFERKLALRISQRIKREVEIVILNDRPLLFIQEVLENCKTVFSRDERFRIKFESDMLFQIQNFNELMKEYDLKRLERYGIK